MATRVEAVPEQRTSRTDTRGQAKVSPVAWEPHAEMDLVDWLQQGKRLGSIGRGAAWWIGDWVNYGNAKFGEKYTRASRTTGYDIQSLMNMAYVASRFEVSRRRENLSWSHHAEVAALPPEQQGHWLELAARNRMSVRRLRDELRALRARRAAAENESEQVTAAVAVVEAPTDQAVAEPVCPRCGYHLEQAEQ
ncbi:LmbU family transcriptional regulator [Goodfellowiella coeruleoviolacea]|uniref:Uncharacterized protein n=1 Tax=Goodfellowiella coeruleoviolacea TaxID=334858 RepID=A0AAE3GAR1_9PSEU|nr:LmbU family transcriptional regulator [Goodfellowiella coeruleoviolacea]MCP2163974.1 hypothetical protein [Goodfellowiella coeruleoviolacea]